MTDEKGYLELVRRVIHEGEQRDNERTGVGTRALFGATCRYNLRDGVLPLFTTKRVSFKNVWLELYFFLTGKSHSYWLEKHGCKIWKGNSSRAFLDKQGLASYPDGQLGPVYGCQWRNFNGDYQGADPVSGESLYGVDTGVDQLAAVINTIKSNPQSRRLLVVAWNPSQLNQMALPPCHVMFQFFVHNNRELSCQMYQRSADLGLGVPYNVASYALLTHIVAHLTGLKAREFIHVMGDCHVYQNHVSALQTQLARSPTPPPNITISPALVDLDDLQLEHVMLNHYYCQSPIKMKMAV